MGLIRGIGASFIDAVRYNRVKEYSRKYVKEYIASTHYKHRNKQCTYIKVFTLRFFLILSSFIITKPS
jgi:hypothetical protein